MSRALVLGLIALGCASTASAQDTRLVKLMPIASSENMQTRAFFGKVVARQTVDLAFQVSGQIVEFPVFEGNPVEAGQLIAKLDLEPFELSLNEAVVRREQAERDVLRLERLSSAAVSDVQREDAATAESLAKITERTAERALENATLTAPFDGIVAAREVANFTTVQAGQAVVRLHDMSETRIEIDVPEILFRQAGEDPDIDIEARFPGSDAVYTLVPREFNAEASAIGQTYRITLAIEDLNGAVILPGSSATVNATLKRTGQRTVLPPSAILTEAAGGAAVMAFRADASDGDVGTVEMVPVEIRATEDGEIELISGPEPGTEIVAAGAARLTDGEAVRRFTGFAN